MSTFSCHMIERIASSMVKAMLGEVEFAILGRSPKPSLGDDGLQSPAKTIWHLSRDVDCSDLDVRLSKVSLLKRTADPLK